MAREFNQCEQPGPQPAAPSGASPSSTWKECPQPHEAETFGLLIAKPAWRPSTQSISVPARYGALNGSTTTSTPFTFSSLSPSVGPRSKPSAYWNPEQPPPWTATRRTAASPTGSSAISCLIFAAALSVSETSVTGRSVISTWPIVATPSAGASPLRDTPDSANFVTAASRLVEPFSSSLVAIA